MHTSSGLISVGARRFAEVASAGLLALSINSSALAQTTCDSIGPDLIMAELTGPTNYTSQDGIEAFSAGHIVCNIGDQPASMIDSTNDHPVYGKSLFKLTLGNADGSTRIEQLGYSWLLHGFFALSDPFCCADCQPGNGTVIGVHCADSNSSGHCGSQGELGPKWQVNPATGEFAYPPANPPWSGRVARRLQAHISELTPSSPTTRYIVEGVVISADDAQAGNGNNNASYRPAALTGGGDAWTLAFAGETVRELPAIYAWKFADPNVVVATADIPADGRIVIAGRANPIAGTAGFWHYEYAVYNLNSARCVRAFSVGLLAGVHVQNAGFHDVDWHSGDGPGGENFDGTDWNFTSSDAARWKTDAFSENPVANAIRWGTLYNFRFDAQAPPVEGSVNLELFAPGTPGAIQAGALPVPGLRTGDANGDGVTDLSDLAQLLSSFGYCATDLEYNSAVDFDRSGCISLGDLALMLALFGQ
jgi:hypothetical protein